MKPARVILAMLLTIVLVGAILFTATAEGNAYGRWDNPGQGHDWNPNAKGNKNDNSNTQHNENGYLNHTGPTPTLPPDDPR